MNDKKKAERLTAIINAHVFDGENEFDDQTVVIKGANILSVGAGGAPEDATVVNARGMTLLPGLIDAHVHTDMSGLRTALSFGVTTELDMQGHWSKRKRSKISRCNDVADLRSPEMGITPIGGHPSEDSVGNWLNDVSKTQPEFVKELCNRWGKESDTKETKYIIKKALRTIDK